MVFCSIHNGVAWLMSDAVLLCSTTKMSFLIVGRWRANGLPRTLMLLSLRIDEKFYDTRSWQIHLLWNHVNDRLGWLGTKASDSRQRCKLQVVELPFLIEILMGTMGIKRTCTVQWTTCCHAAFYDLLLFSSSTCECGCPMKPLLCVMLFQKILRSQS